MPKEVDMNRLYTAAMAVKTVPEAERWTKILAYLVADLEENTAQHAIGFVKNAIGYLAGYANNVERDRIERLYGTRHPVFGTVSEDGIPTPEQAFQLGYDMAARYKQQINESQEP